MVIKEGEYLEIILNGRIDIWTKKLGYLPELNKPTKIHWTLLKGTSFRDLKIQVECDNCGKTYNKAIRRLNNYDICKSCSKKGDKNPMFGVPNSEKNKEAKKEGHKKFRQTEKWKIIKAKTSERMKGNNHTLGFKHSDKTKKKKSEIALNAYRKGLWKLSNGYSNIKKMKYNTYITYQGTYELKFLEYLEKIKKLHLIEKGPKIPYTINGENHTYYVDFQIKNTDILFEVKSSYYWQKKLDVNICKKETCEKNYNYILIIDNDFSQIENLLLKYGL